MLPNKVDVVVIGQGPAGLAAGINLVRLHRKVMIVDSNKPRHAATLQSHGFLTRDGASPLEFRKLAREEFESYDEASFVQATVESVTGDVAKGFAVSASDKQNNKVQVEARIVIVATGLSEELPDIPLMRAFYGTAIHSCIACDAYEKANQPLVYISENNDTLRRVARLLNMSDDITVFTNDSKCLSVKEEATLLSWGVKYEPGKVSSILGERGKMLGVEMEDGRVIEAACGFVRPFWHANVAFLQEYELSLDKWGLIKVDKTGETKIHGLYAAGDITPPGPEQLLVAAGDGVRVANNVHNALAKMDIAAMLEV